LQTLGSTERRLLSESDPLPKTTEVGIIGAGMIGLAAAYYLSAAGLSSICIIDRQSAVGEASGANAGGLWFGQQSRELGALAPLAQASSRLYDELAAVPGPDFEFRRTGVLELLRTEDDLLRAEERLSSVREAGFEAESIGCEELQRLEPGLSEGQAGAVFYPQDAQLHPAKLGARLVRHLKNRNVKFCFHAEVASVGARLETSLGEIEATTVIIAAGAWTPLVTRTLGWTPPIKPMRGQLLATVPLAPLLRHTVLGERYYYWQLSSGHVVGGGTVEDVGFARGVDPRDLASIRSELEALFPQLHDQPTACAWSGFRPYCEDMRPVIGKVPGREHVYVAAGHFRKGILLAPVTGKILADLITRGKTNLPIEPLSPGRFGV